MVRLLAALLVLFTVVSLAGDSSNPTDIEMDFWTQRVKKDPSDFLSLQKLATSQLQKARESGDYAFLNKSEENLKLALKANPKNPEARALMANVLCVLHRFDDALPFAEEAVHGMPDDGFPQGVLGDIALEK